MDISKLKELFNHPLHSDIVNLESLILHRPLYGQRIWVPVHRSTPHLTMPDEEVSMIISIADYG